MVQRLNAKEGNRVDMSLTNVEHVDNPEVVSSFLSSYLRHG